MSKSYIITGVTFDNKRVTPIVCKNHPESHIGHIKHGTIWLAVRYGHTYRKLVKRFTNSDYTNEN